jgi:hypothetical protein
MNNTTSAAPCWRTSSFGHLADTSAGDLAELGAHVHLCRRANAQLFSLRCKADVLKTFMSTRIVTTLVVGTLLLAAGSVML